MSAYKIDLDYEIREAEEGDIPEIQRSAEEIYERVYQDSRILSARQLRGIQEEWFDYNSLNDMMEDQDTRFAVVDNGRGIIGFTTVHYGDGIHNTETVEEWYNQGEVAEEGKMYVDPLFTGKGIGWKMHNENQKWMQDETPAEYTIIHVFADNYNAVNTFNRWGYEPLAKGKVELFGEEVDELVMDKRINPQINRKLDEWSTETAEV